MNTSIQPTLINNGLPAGSIIPGEEAKINPVEAGSIVGLPVGSIVHVNVNGSLVPVKTVPAPMASTTVQQTVPLPPPAVTSTYQTQSVQVPQFAANESVQVTGNVQGNVTSTYQTQSVQVPQFAANESVQVTGNVQGNPTPTIKTLPPRIVKNELPAKYNTVTLPPKVVTTRLSPILPPPTPKLSIPTPPAQSVTLPQTAVHSSVTLPPPVQSVAVPQTIQTSIPLPPPQSVTLPPPVQSVAVPQTIQTSIPLPPPQSVTLPTTTQSVTVPQTIQSVYNPTVQSVPVPLPPTVNTSVQGLATQPNTTQYASTSFNPITTQYGTASVGQISPYATTPLAAPYGTPSVGALGTQQITTGNQTIVGTQPLPTLKSLI